MPSPTVRVSRQDRSASAGTGLCEEAVAVDPIAVSVLVHALGAALALSLVAVAGWWFQPDAGSLVGDRGLAVRVAAGLLFLVLYQHWAAPNLLGWALILAWGVREGLYWPRLPVRDGGP
jgi:hypothetical protein